ncbi:uncharacterized protein PgNI_02851 [Pyricularia grisea]|uniref:Zn(2)-C6 fungal-type domain-containing protein n=1 Tax=Pyricularia grisea TaxID=148305 RepID=A0A6P8BE26_PYRGI|nr:uncharacterized protein PgNI_02851 [Pyricularia grisea]TLD14073.1 hypothetical protein PgNI_02851 [Pyricularia grisea]
MATLSGSQESNVTPLVKRRKIRKGTQSCWECKRRKMRCTFDNSGAGCVACQRRGSACIGQDLPEEPVGVSMAARLKQMEASIEALAQVMSPAVTPDATLTPQPARTKTTQPTIDSVHLELFETTPELTQLSRQLVSAWPTGEALAEILALPVSAGPLLHAALACTPPSSAYYQAKLSSSTRDILQTPEETWHPITIARSLLILAIFLDCGPSPRFDHTKVRALKAAQSCISGDTDLLGSIEGIECIFLLSQSENISGNLRRSWLSNKRAMALAQMMGLDRCKIGQPVKQSIKFVHGDTHNRVDLEYIWFRIVMSDRYLCLMLNLPPGTTDNRFASPEALATCIPIERLERLECAAAGLMLQRETCTESMATTIEVDKMLQQAAACMPTQWWLIPTQKGEALTYQDRIKVMYQFTHYYLLGQAHLPYLLSTSTDSRHICSKITAVNASREVLSRFVAFDEHDASHHCHGIGFLTFTAITALCVAHIDVRRQPASKSSFGFLSHQRPGDRGLMERAVDRIRGSERPLAIKTVEILEKLLAIEAYSAGGTRYSANSNPHSDEEEECSGNVNGGMDDRLRIHIPYLGTVEIRRALDLEQLPGIETGNQGTEPGNMSGQTPAGLNWTQWSDTTLLDSVAGTANDHSQNILPSLAAGVEDWAMQGVDMALFDRLIRGVEDPASQVSSWLHLQEDNSI